MATVCYCCLNVISLILLISSGTYFEITAGFYCEKEKQEEFWEFWGTCVYFSNQILYFLFNDKIYMKYLRH